MVDDDGLDAAGNGKPGLFFIDKKGRTRGAGGQGEVVGKAGPASKKARISESPARGSTEAGSTAGVVVGGEAPPAGLAAGVFVFVRACLRALADAASPFLPACLSSRLSRSSPPRPSLSASRLPACLPGWYSWFPYLVVGTRGFPISFPGGLAQGPTGHGSIL